MTIISGGAGGEQQRPRCLRHCCGATSQVALNEENDDYSELRANHPHRQQQHCHHHHHPQGETGEVVCP